MRTIFQIILLVALSLNCRAAIVPILRNVFTTNTFDTDIVGGAIPYFDFPSGKFVSTGLIYTNGFLFEPTLGTFSVFHTNITGDLMLVLQEGGPAGPSIQGYSDKLVVANTNLTFDAVGPFSIRLRVDGSNVLEAVAGSISLSGKTNLVADDGSSLTYNGVPIGGATTLNLANFGGLTGVTLTNIYAPNLPAGDNDIFVVATGTRVMLLSLTVGTTNTSTYYGEVKTNGIYTKLLSTGSSTATTNTSIGTFCQNQNQNPYIFEFGETIALNTASTGINAILFLAVLDSTVPIVCSKLFAVSGGNDTVYTVPTGKIAVGLWTSSLASLINPICTYFNRSSVNRVFTEYVVPFGGSADSTTRRTRATIANNGVNGGTLPVLWSGDSYIISSDASTATQLLWLTVLEVPL
jgi:hypothetical protein